MSKRIKRSFSSADQVLHLWANQVQEGAYCRNVFFNGDTVYSYGNHYTLGKLYKFGKKTVAIINDERYSATTANHQAYARGAVSHLPFIIGNPNELKASVKARREALIAELDKFFRRRTARISKWNTIKDHVGYATNGIVKFNEFCDVVGMKSHKIKLNVKAIEAHIRKCDKRTKQLRKLKLTPEYQAKQEKARQRKVELELKKAENEKIAWLDGGHLTQAVRNLPEQYIRVHGDRVETTKGAFVELAEAKRFLIKLLNNAVKAGDQVGHYTYTRTEGNVVVIGCHRIDLNQAVAVLKAA